MGNIPGGQARGPFVPGQGFGQQGFSPQQGQYQGYPGPPQANYTLPPYGQSGLNHPSQGNPHGYPPQGYPPQGYPPQGYPPQGYPPQGYPHQGYPPQGYPHQGYPPRGPGGYPGQAPQSGSGGKTCWGVCLALLTCLLCSCCNTHTSCSGHDEREEEGEGEGEGEAEAEGEGPPPASEPDEHDEEH